MRSKFFPQFVEKMEKLKLSLSKQHDKMLKIKHEMLKIRKCFKIIQLAKISRENFLGIFRIPESRRFLVLRKFPGTPEKFFRFRVVENPKKKEILSLAISRTFCRSANGPVLLLFSSIGPLTSHKTIIEIPLNLFISNDTLRRFNFANSKLFLVVVV